MDTPTPISVHSVLMLAEDLLKAVSQELERATSSRPERAREIRQLKVTATALGSRLQQLMQRRDEAALWEIGELLASTRDLEQQLSKVMR